MSKWNFKPLSALSEEITVGFVGPMASEYVEKGIPFLRSQNVIPFHLKMSGLKFISSDFHKRIKKSALKPGDVVVVRTGTPGASAVIPNTLQEANCSDLVIIRCGERLDPSFISYFINSLTNTHIQSQLVGAVQQHFNVGSAKELLVPDISLDEQKAIAEVLSSLDDKIDLLHRQNKTLEALAETLFRQWFVEEAEESWERKSLDQIANYLNGLALQKYPVNGGESLPVIKIRELNQGITDSTDKCSRAIPEQYIIQDGDVLFSWSGSLQIVIWHDGEGALNQHLFKVTSKNYPKWFYYFATKHHLEDFRAIAESKSTTMGHIQRHHLTEAFVSIPPEELFTQYDNSISPLIEKLIKNNAQIKSLTKQRDTLLPKLMSGEVRVEL